MNIIKNVVHAIWPIIYRVLEKKVNDTTTPFDNIALQAADAAIDEWLNDTENDVQFT